MPVVDYINTYRREIAAFFANSTATTQASGQNITQTKSLHYLRISNPVNPEVLTAYQNRLSSNRGNPYMHPGPPASCLPDFLVWRIFVHEHAATDDWSDGTG